MAKRKAEIQPSENGVKKAKLEEPVKATMMVDSDSDSEGGAELDASAFTVNEEYAKRFEHNKKREEMHRCKSRPLV